MSEGWVNGHWAAFKCPLCGSRSYVPVRIQKANGHWYTTASYQCFHCSVVFRDPVLFTQCTSKTRNPELGPGGAHRGSQRTEELGSEGDDSAHSD